MKPFNINSTLKNRDAIFSTFWSTLQQVVVAASTYFIMRAIQHATSNEVTEGLVYLCAFVACLILVYVPCTISMLYLQRWRITSIQTFIQEFVRYNYGKTSAGHSRNKIHLESWITNESFTVYDKVTDLLYQIYSTLLNSTLNIVVIAVALDPRILFWYGIAGFVLLGSNFAFKNKISSISLAVQGNRKDLSNVMLLAWDNIFIGNGHNFNNWNFEFNKQIQEAKKVATNYDLVRSLISSSTVVFALLIIAIGNSIYLYENVTNISAVAALIITMPRQLQIVQSIFNFFNLALSWTGARQQLKELENVILESELINNSRGFVQLDKIEIMSSASVPVNSTIENLYEYISEQKLGRFTLRGKNGTGKSTLLTLLKESLKERAFFLPTHYADLKFKNDFLNHSDGNRLLTLFNEIAQMDQIEFLILDEWDANLDKENLSALDLVIQDLSRTKVIIESRHRN